MPKERNLEANCLLDLLELLVTKTNFFPCPKSELQNEVNMNVIHSYIHTKYFPVFLMTRFTFVTIYIHNFEYLL